MNKSKPVAHIITKNSVTVNFDGKTFAVSKDNEDYAKVIDAISREAWDEIPALVDKPSVVGSKSGGKFRVVDGTILLEDGRKAPDALGQKIIEFMDNNLPFKHLVNFANNLLKNPSYRSVNQLFQFLEKNQHPITPDGNFIAYKKVTRCVDGVLRDTYTKKFVNEPGTTVEMPRNEVNEDPEQTCSYGLHVANWDYAKNHYGNHDSTDVMLEVEVNPADVVAVPVDYNNSKMRVCRYVVRGEVQNPNENLHVIPDFNHEDNCNECDVCPENCDTHCDDESEPENCDYCGSESCDGYDCEDRTDCPGCGDYLENCVCEDDCNEEENYVHHSPISGQENCEYCDGTGLDDESEDGFCPKCDHGTGPDDEEE